jgi:hypothetical protein
VRLKFIIILATVGGVSSFAENPDVNLTDAEKKLFSSNYLVPSPNELFMALDNLNQRNWDDIVTLIKDDENKMKSDYKDSIALAMNLGIRVADGLLGVAAKDKALIVEIGPVIKRLAQRLGVQSSLIGVGDRVKQYAEAEKWAELTHELNDLQSGILEEMVRLRDSDAATLGSIAGWLEGLHLITKSLSTNYDENGSEILRQPSLVEHFITELSKIDKSLQEKQIVLEITAGLQKIKSLCEVDREAPVTKDNVKALYGISSTLITKIQRS